VDARSRRARLMAVVRDSESAVDQAWNRHCDNTKPGSSSGATAKASSGRTWARGTSGSNIAVFVAPFGMVVLKGGG